jgi:hypothetical protein
MLYELLERAGNCLAWQLVAHPVTEGILHPAGKFVLIGDTAYATPPHLCVTPSVPYPTRILCSLCFASYAGLNFWMFC